MAASVNALSSINQEQFLQLLVAQLQNQDPLDPVSNQDFISQLATLNTVSSLQQLNASFDQQLKLQQLTQGADLIGKTISYLPSAGAAPLTGTVSSVQIQDGNFVLQVGADQVTLAQVQSVR
ncbi:MAG: flagellar hook capping protein [Gemmataceae bacterium]|nr:flagellar hook capping protein [Gemmataceae bacterium]